MEVVEDETPHVQHKLKDVAIEEVEGVHAHGGDKFDIKTEICNLDDTKIVKERRGGGGGYRNTHEVLGELLMRPQYGSQFLVTLHPLFMAMKL